MAFLRPRNERREPCAPGEVGRVVVTDLLNRAMPLIRYEVGDLSAWSTSSCPCGRGMPTLSHIVGRTADAFVRPDGSLIAGVSLVERTLTAVTGIAQLQLVQTGPQNITANLVTAADFSSATIPALHQQLDRAFGCPITLDVQEMRALPQERNGKYRFAIRRPF